MKIIGTGSATPELEITNEMLTHLVDTSDEWISTRTGIKSRRVLSKESITDLALKSSQEAIKDAGVDPNEIDFIICHNVINDRITPALACLIQNAIGAKCPAMDINAACSGFVFALDLANTYIKAGHAKKILITCAEQLSRFTDWSKRESCVLFGDGAGSVVVSEGGMECQFNLTTQYSDALYCNAIYADTPFKKEVNDYNYLTMKGRDVFKLAVMNSSNDIQTVMDKANLTADEVGHFILHQANIRIVEAIRHQLKQPEEKFPHNIENHGNTSSASIPILLDELNKANQLKEEDVVVFSAFGAGFSSGACLIKWGKNI